MTDDRLIPTRLEQSILGLILLLFGLLSVVGITWGLPSRSIDPYLFGEGEPWSGEKIYRLAGAAQRFSPGRGADVDVDPISGIGDEPTLLTGTPEDVAKIYLRYRLYTYQPDEMITMMALSGMNPRRLQLDPKLYQYGGLFIYPVGAIIGVAGVTGLIDLRSDVTFYLDHPDEFGKFYVVARAYAAAWGMIGVLVVFAIGRRLAGSWAGLLAALLFTLMPVVVCMAHEGKPHLPGAVLMLAAVLFAMRHLAIGATAVQASSSDAGKPPGSIARDWWFMCICCGASLGMVLSSLPIFVLIPLVAWLAMECQEDGITRGRLSAVARRTIVGVAVASVVYLVTNPYIAINAVVNRGVLASNFGNSLAMYDISRVVEGFVRVLALTTEGASLPIVGLGVAALVAAGFRRCCVAGASSEAVGRAVDLRVAIIPLAVPAAVFFLQFVLIGAGKPGEYGRFGVFTNTALAIGTACLLSRRCTPLRAIVNWLPILLVVCWTGVEGWAYLRNFSIDASNGGSRLVLAEQLQRLASAAPSNAPRLAVSAEPAPYSCPPLRFDEWTVVLHDLPRDGDRCDVGFQAVDVLDASPGDPRPTDARTDRKPDVPDLLHQARVTPISWANKPFRLYQAGRPTTSFAPPQH